MPWNSANIHKVIFKMIHDKIFIIPFCICICCKEERDVSLHHSRSTTLWLSRLSAKFLGQYWRLSSVTFLSSFFRKLWRQTVAKIMNFAVSTSTIIAAKNTLHRATKIPNTFSIILIFGKISPRYTWIKS